jgi:hypothetical protein
MHAVTLPIAQKHYKPYKGDKAVNCALCGHRTAKHSIVFYEDLPYAIRLLIQGKSEKEANEFVWQRAVREQQKGIYRAHKTVLACSDCVTVQLDHETGNPDSAKSYLDGIEVNDDCSLIIGRFADRPYHPALFFTECQSVDAFLDQFRAQSLRGNLKRCSLPRDYAKNALSISGRLSG